MTNWRTIVALGIAAAVVGTVAYRTVTEPSSEPAAPATTAARAPGEAAYLAALRTYRPDVIRGNEDRAVRRGWNTCQQVRDAIADTATINHSAAERFSGGDVVLTDEQGAQMVALARQHLCP